MSERKKIFCLFAEESKTDSIIGNEGIEKMCKQMSFDMAASAEILVFMWLCECKTYGEISEEEFLRGCEKLKVTDLQDLTDRATNDLSNQLRDHKNPDFKKFFKFVFIFHREGMYKNVEVETCSVLLKMMFGDKYKTIKLFISFCEARELQVLTLDQWESLFDLIL